MDKRYSQARSVGWLKPNWFVLNSYFPDRAVQDLTEVHSVKPGFTRWETQSMNSGEFQGLLCSMFMFSCLGPYCMHVIHPLPARKHRGLLREFVGAIILQCILHIHFPCSPCTCLVVGWSSTAVCDQRMMQQSITKEKGSHSHGSKCGFDTTWGSDLALDFFCILLN